MQSDRSGRRSSGASFVLAVFLVAAALNLAWLGRAPLFDTTEARHAEVAREFAAEGQWLVPTLNGWPHLTKPPLTDWLGAAGILLFGANEFGARFANALVAALGAALVAGFARELAGRSRRAGLAAAALYAACPLYLGLARVISIDILLATLMAGSYWMLWRLARTDLRRPKLAASGLAALAALAVLAKGHAVLLLLAPGLVWLAPVARRRAWRHLLASPAPAVFLMLALPWFVHIVRIFPGWLAVATGRELGERVVGSGGGAYVPGRALLYYLAGALPALPLAVWGALNCRHSAFGIRLSERKEPSAVPVPEVECRKPFDNAQGLGREPVERPNAESWLPAGAGSLLLLWALAPLAVFAAIKGQRWNYVVPLVPPAAILAGVAWDRLAGGWAGAGRAARTAAAAAPALLGLVGLAALAAAALHGRFASEAPMAGTIPAAIAAGAAMAVGGAACLAMLRAGRMRAAEAAFGLAVLGLWGISVPLAAEYEGRNSTRASCRWIAAHARPGETVMLYREYIHSANFYLRRRLPVARPNGEVRDWLELWAADWPPCRDADLLPSDERMVEAARRSGVWLIAGRSGVRPLEKLAKRHGLRLEQGRFDREVVVVRMGPKGQGQ